MHRGAAAKQILFGRQFFDGGVQTVDQKYVMSVQFAKREYTARRTFTLYFIYNNNVELSSEFLGKQTVDLCASLSMKIRKSTQFVQS